MVAVVGAVSAFGTRTPMSIENVIGQEASQVEQSDEFAVAVETPELRPSVEQEIQGKVYTNHPEVRGLTLEAEERLAAREWELERTRARFDDRQDSDREARTRQAAWVGSEKRRRRFEKRAASVDPWCDPDRADAREQLRREELGAVNAEAARLVGKLEGWSRAAVSRMVAERVVDGVEFESAVFEVFDELLTGPGGVIPIASVGLVDRAEVDIEGEVVKLFEPSHSSIEWVGLVADETETIKVTSWHRSEKPTVEEGDHIRLRSVAKNWYQGRVSVAVTGRSDVVFFE